MSGKRQEPSRLRKRKCGLIRSIRISRLSWLAKPAILLKQYSEAQRWLRQCTARAPNHQYGHAFLAATYAQLGQLEDARAEAAEVLRVNPKYSIGETQKRVSFFKRSEDMEHLIDGLRKAGLPE